MDNTAESNTETVRCPWVSSSADNEMNYDNVRRSGLKKTVS